MELNIDELKVLRGILLVEAAELPELIERASNESDANELNDSLNTVNGILDKVIIELSRVNK